MKTEKIRKKNEINNMEYTFLKKSKYFSSKHIAITLSISIVLALPILIVLLIGLLLLSIFIIRLSKLMKIKKKHVIIDILLLLCFVIIQIPGYIDWSWLDATWFWLTIRFTLLIFLVYVNVKINIIRLKLIEDENQYLIISSFVIYILMLVTGSLIMYGLGYKPVLS